MHFFNPAPVQQFVEVIRTVITADDVFEDVKALAERLGKKPVIVGDKAGLHRQRPALRLPQPRGVDVREPLRHPRGPRRRDALRLRLPDGPARAARPDRPRHGLRDPRHDVQAGPRPAARPEPDHQADGQRRAARPQDRAAASTPTPRPARPRSSPTRRPPPAGRPPGVALRPVSPPWVSSARARWRPASSRCSPRPGYAVTFVARSEEKVAGVLHLAGSQLRPRRREGPDGPGGRRRAAGPRRRRDRSRGAGRRRPRRRGDRRGPRRQAGPLPRPRPDLQARRHPRHDHVVAADHRLRQGHRPAAGRHRDALLQPGPDHEARRGRAHRVDGPGRHRDGAGPLRQGRQGGRDLRRPLRVHRQRAALPVPQRRRADARGQLRHAPTTSTPR